MRTIETQEVDRFAATGDDGKLYTVFEYRNQIHTQALAGNRETLEGLGSFRLADGARVHRLSDSEFEVAKTGVKLRRH